MKSILSVGLVLCIFASASITGAEPTPPGSAEGRLPTIDVVSTDESGFSLEYVLGDLPIDDVTLGGESFQAIRIPGGGLVGEIGAPALPTFARLIAIPERSGVRIRVTRLEEEEIPDVRLAPVDSGRPEEFAIDLASYSRDEFDALEDVSLGEPSLLRDLRVVNLKFQPVHYNPAQRLLRVVRKMRVDVEFTGEDPRNVPLTPNRPIPPSFDQLYEGLVVNYEDSGLGRAVAPGSYLVICRDDAGVISRLQPLLDWRQRSGYPTVLATTSETGTTRTSIKNFIQNAYDSWEIPPEFVVLAGDADGSYGIATWFEGLSGYGGEGDHPYTTLAGNDILADVHIGRLSFGTYSDLELIVEKILAYESDPSLDDPGWFGRACLVGDPSTSGRSTIIANQWLKERLLDLNYTEIDTIWSDPFVSGMTVALNKGGTIFTYRGYYGMSGWSNGLSEALNNGDRMHFAVVITCDTGSFADGTARSEGLLRAGSPGDPGGAIGAIGTATIGTHTRYNNCMHYGIFRGLLEEDMPQTGVALTRGKLEVYLNYYDQEPDKAEIWAYWNNLMGDPAVDIYSGYPYALTVTHVPEITFGANSLVVDVKQGLSPIEGALVCAWKGDETYAVGYSDSQGRIELPLTNESLGDLLLTVTHHDNFAYTATVPVVSPSVYVGYLESSVDDDDSGTSLGNGDGLPNPGETVELPVRLKNFGLGSASGVNATLTTSDPFVTILDDSEDYGNLPGGASVWSPDDFDLRIDPQCPHGRVLRFGLDVTSGADVWHSLVELPIVAPALSVESVKVHDPGNGMLDPGETADISIVLRNEGGADAGGVTTTLVSGTPFLDVQDDGGLFGDIGAGGSVENVSDHFVVTADPSTYGGYLAALTLIAEYSGGIVDTLELSLQVGTRSSDDPVGPDRYGYLAFDDTDSDYPEAPVYDWIEIDTGEGGSGEKVVLGDFGVYQDKSTVVDIPFEFQYYGETYDRATICSNGWLAMGNTYLTSYRNWTIPGAGGPDAMIAPFWDDLLETNGGEVYQWFDAANHRWIVEWSQMRNDYNGAIETFQVILYDPAFHPTGTGDGDIVFQYQSVSVSDPVDGYATVGIENHDQDDGVLYAYFSQYSAGAAPLQAGRAIAFRASESGPLGTLSGEVLNGSYGDAPIEGAEVRILETGRTFATGQDGNYSGLVPLGTYTVVAEFEGFAPDTTQGVLIEEGEIAHADFSLLDIAGPAIVTTEHPSTEDTVGPYPIPVSVVERSGLEIARLYYRANGGGFVPLDLQPLGGDDFLAEIPGQSHTTLVQYYILAEDGIGFETTDPSEAPTALYSFLVAPLDELLDDDFEGDLGWTVGAGDDDANTGIWLRADPVGTVEDGNVVQPEDDHSPNDGLVCFITGNTNPGESAGTNDVDGGKTTLFSPVFDLEGFETAAVDYWCWYSNHQGSSPGEDSWIVQVTADGSSWVDLENTTQNTAEQWVQRSFVIEDFIDLTANVQLRFIASDEGGGSLVEAGVDDFLLRGMDTSTADVELDQATLAVGLGFTRPNPAHPDTRISYRLPAATDLSLRIYDVSGRLVRTLAGGTKGAGEHEVVWDGRDDASRRLASGIYFLRFQTPTYMEVRQIGLLR